MHQAFMYSFDQETTTFVSLIGVLLLLQAQACLLQVQGNTTSMQFLTQAQLLLLQVIKLLLNREALFLQLGTVLRSIRTNQRPDGDDIFTREASGFRAAALLEASHHAL